MHKIPRYNVDAVYNKNETEQVTENYQIDEISDLHDLIEGNGKTFYALDKITITLKYTDLKTTLDAAEQE